MGRDRGVLGIKHWNNLDWHTWKMEIQDQNTITCLIHHLPCPLQVPLLATETWTMQMHTKHDGSLEIVHIQHILGI